MGGESHKKATQGFAFKFCILAQMVKNLPAMQEMWVRALGCEDPLEKEMATHSSILAWEIPWTEEPDGLQFMVSQESDMTQRLSHHHHFQIHMAQYWPA